MYQNINWKMINHIMQNVQNGVNLLFQFIKISFINDPN